MGPDATSETAVQRATFDELSPHQLYALLQLRSDVFVVEQACVFLELDGQDHLPGAEHLWTADDAGVTSTLRLLPGAGGTWHLGRVVARRDARSRGVAARLVQAGLDRLRELGATRVEIGAQAHLHDWYARFGFVQSGPGYLEDGIPHLPMALELEGAER